jgi:D-3-phosphoglycerate dehydrogenase
MKVLSCERLTNSALKVLEDVGIEVHVNPGLSYDELIGMIGDYDALVTDGAMPLNDTVLDRASRLRVIGRAGSGVDNVDVKAASKRGIVVMNTPDADAVATAEHAIALMLALSRMIPQADRALKEGRNEVFEGRELCGKVLGLVGAGHIGRVVADRAKAMRMKVLAHDPFIRPEVLERLDVEPVTFDELLSRSDYISIHAPRTKGTQDLFGKDVLGRMKRGSMLVNCSHADIIKEEDLYEALRSGHLAGAALDSFRAGASSRLRLMGLPNFICTPNLSGSTAEAREAMSGQLAGQMAGYLLHGSVNNAVNVPAISPELMTVLGPYATLAERIGLFHAQLAESALLDVDIELSGAITAHDTTALSRAVLKGLLTPIMGDGVNFINAAVVAEDRGIRITESRRASCEDFASLVSVRVQTAEAEHVISGTIFGARMPRIIRIDDFRLEAVPEGHLLFITSEDRPGVIGLIGTTLGKHGININRMQVGQQPEGGNNIILLTTGSSAPGEALRDLRALAQVDSVKTIEL